jgi:hypothetical protein
MTEDAMLREHQPRARSTPDVPAVRSPPGPHATGLTSCSRLISAVAPSEVA